MNNDENSEKSQLLARLKQSEAELGKKQKKSHAPKLNTMRATLLTAPEITEQFKAKQEAKKLQKASQKKEN